MRGRAKSEGDYSLWRDSGDDGSDTIEWIRAQSWSNGLVIQYGYSADGISGVLTLTEFPAPEGLVAQFIQEATGLVYESLFNGGCYREMMINGWLSFLGETSSIPLVYSNEQYGEWWYPNDLSRNWSNVGVAGVHTGSWYDPFNQGSLDTFDGYQNKGGVGARGEQYLVMSVGGHCKGLDEKFPNEEFGAQLANQIAMFVFGKALTGHDFPSPYSSLNLYLMGPIEQNKIGNFWVCLDDWPLVNPFSLYLHSDGSLSSSIPSEGADSSTTFTYNLFLPWADQICCLVVDQWIKEKLNNAKMYWFSPLMYWRRIWRSWGM